MTQNSINNSGSELTVDNLFLDGNTVSSLDTNGDITFSPDGTGVVSVTTAPIVPSGDRADSIGSATNSWDNFYINGLTFNDGTDILSTYLTPTSWTPVLEGVTTPGAGTYSTQTGIYMRIGDIVIAYFSLAWSAHTGTGNMQISGLPITCTSTSGYSSMGIAKWWNLTVPANTMQCLTIVEASTDIIFLGRERTSGRKGGISMDTAANVTGSVWYMV